MRTPRRVVTGWGEDGEPIALFAGAPPTTLDFESAQASELWVTGGSPAEVHARADAAAGEWQLEPPPGGSAFRLVTYAPGAEVDVARHRDPRLHRRRLRRADARPAGRGSDAGSG